MRDYQDKRREGKRGGGGERERGREGDMKRDTDGEREGERGCA